MTVQCFPNRVTSPHRVPKRAGRLEHKPSSLRRFPVCERLEDRLAPSLNPALFELDKNAVNAPATGDDWNNVLCPINASGLCTSQPNPGPGGGSLANTGVLADPAGTSIFTTGGSKDDLDVPNWQHTSGSVPDKDEITNAYAAAYFQGGSQFIYFGADRFANNGSATFGFWFF